MRSLEETRLRSEDVGLSSIFNDDDDGSDTSMEMLKDEVVLRFKQLFGTNVLHHLGSNNHQSECNWNNFYPLKNKFWCI